MRKKRSQYSFRSIAEIQVGCGNTGRLWKYKPAGNGIPGAKWEYNVNMDSECVHAIWTHLNFHIHKFTMSPWGLNMKLHNRSDASSGVVFGDDAQTGDQLDGYISSGSAVQLSIYQNSHLHLYACIQLLIACFESTKVNSMRSFNI